MTHATIMRTKLNKREIQTLESISARLSKIYYQLEENDVELHYGNGTAASQISCALASLDCILQENETE